MLRVGTAAVRRRSLLGFDCGSTLILLTGGAETVGVASVTSYVVTTDAACRGRMLARTNGVVRQRDHNSRAQSVLGEVVSSDISPAHPGEEVTMVLED